MTADVGIVGAGPAGLACAIGLRLRGLSVTVYERGVGPRDKACGEGIMPKGLAHLKALGVHIPQSFPIRGIRYINEDSRSVAALLPAAGLGVRRLALSNAMRARAVEVGAVITHSTIPNAAGVDARFVIAADGLHSPLRTQAGLHDDSVRPRRFGLRQHFKLTPWTDHVEVYFSEAVEAYITPVAPDEIGVAFLWNEDRVDATGGFAALLARFPHLQTRLATVDTTSSARGAGPLEQAAQGVIADNFALVGDAAGYVDAITGEGISLALQTAAVLVDEVASQRTGLMQRYARYHRRTFFNYSLLARALLVLAARPALRRLVIRTLPSRVFAWLLRLV